MVRVSGLKGPGTPGTYLLFSLLLITAFNKLCLILSQSQAIRTLFYLERMRSPAPSVAFPMDKLYTYVRTDLGT